MLELMGMVCVTSDGEGEALCARLDADGVVDGCFTQDGDVFLYGARRVYRNLRLANHRGCGGATFDIFDMDRIESTLRLDRECLIVLALLLGCDYDEKGVGQVGKQKAVKLLTEVWRNSDESPLERFCHVFTMLIF